jgi:FAD synthetase
LEEVKSSTSIKAIFMGTRRTDPYSNFLSPFAPTDPDWPSFIRKYIPTLFLLLLFLLPNSLLLFLGVLPILDWDYTDVWSLLLDLNIQYCPLYDKGFTSIGYTHDTEPNPALRISTEESEEEEEKEVEEEGKDGERRKKEKKSKYAPAWTLLNCSVERNGRTPKTARAEA